MAQDVFLLSWVYDGGFDLCVGGGGTGYNYRDCILLSLLCNYFVHVVCAFG